MKLGLILECGPQGADKKVCEHLVKMLDPDIEITSVTLTNKPGLIQNCAGATAQLLRDGCDRVVIVWDLYPAWRDDGARPCCKQDREQILAKLEDAKINTANVFLVCIREELEAWLLADGRAVSRFLSTPTRAITIRDEPRPETVRNPKAKLSKHFRENTGKLYSDLLHAERIVREITDFTRLRRSQSFVRFALKTTGRDSL